MKRLLFLLAWLLALPLPRLAAQPNFAAFDKSITDLMAKYDLPGASIAVARNGKLVVARAYGLADKEHQVPSRPDTLFRLASLSKPFTAMGILKLVDEGRLDPDARAFRILDQLQPPGGKPVDSRIYDITVRQLLQHSGGWDRMIGGDVAAMGPAIATALNVPAPVTAQDIVRYGMGCRLDFAPGERFAYSNLGYLILGRIIEKVTGMPYETYIRSLLAPVGITRMRTGPSFIGQRAAGEAIYYDVPGAPQVWTLLRGGSPIVARPYAMDMQAADANGGWIASAVDVVRFALAMDEKSGRPLLLQPSTLHRMVTDVVPIAANVNLYYGLGWTVEPAVGEGDPKWWHGGAMSGSATTLVRMHDGLVYSALFNSYPWANDFGDISTNGDKDKAVVAAIESIKEWPEEDLFPLYR